MERAAQRLKNGWRGLLMRDSGALTYFGTEHTEANESTPAFPHWSRLAAETWETAFSVVIRLEIPGTDEHDLSVDIRGHVLRIRGVKRSGGAQEGRHYHLMERAYGRFERSLRLPRGVDPDQAEISCRNGVLTVILPKTDTLPPRGPVAPK